MRFLFKLTESFKCCFPLEVANWIKGGRATQLKERRKKLRLSARKGPHRNFCSSAFIAKKGQFLRYVPLQAQADKSQQPREELRADRKPFYFKIALNIETFW